MSSARWRASPISATTATGPDRSSTRPTGTPSAAWPGIRSCPPRTIAEEWMRMTFGNDPRFVGAMVPMMMGSREAVVDYMTPLGLAHLMGTDHHYGPAPWVTSSSAPEWNPVYYHRADADGIGFDRTATGSNAVAQYAPPVARRFADLRDRRRRLSALVPPRAVGLPAGVRPHACGTSWSLRYTRASTRCGEMRRTWASLAPLVDRPAPRRGRRVPRHPGAGGAMVARCLHRLFPEHFAPAAARRHGAAGPPPFLLRSAAIPLRAGPAADCISSG